jgi:type IV secretion system protein TrbG
MTYLTTAIAAFIAAGALTGPAEAQSHQPPSDLVGGANAAALKGPKDASLVGALHEFAWERGALYLIQSSPERITDITLESGEALLSVSAGDTTRWIVGDARSGVGTAAQAHVLVKPNAPGLATNLVIMTDRRVYHVELKSIAGPGMAAVAWRYPAEMVLTSQPLPAPAKIEKPFSPETLNVHYRINGDRPEWRPVAAFDNGRQVFIEMPAAVDRLEAPPLFVIGDEGVELVNYRVQGRYYVVDRLFAKAELRLGASWKQKIVRIERTTPIAATVKDGPHE